MRLEHIVTAAVEHLLARLLRRALLAILIAGLAIVAIYHFTIAGTLGLETQYSALQARLIIGGIYTAFALVVGAVLWSMRSKVTGAGAAALAPQREMQLAMLVEAVMVGYALARKGERVS
jgi:hypothetical protein